MHVELKNLTKTYGDRTVLNINDFSIGSGEFLGIIGANGAGKSTMLNLIAGLDQPTTGKIFYEHSNSVNTPLKDMTLVFQKPYLLSTTVEKNIAYPLKLRGYSHDKIETRITFLMEELGILSLRKQKAWKLSGGETQKVALARALSFGPKLLLLDEPTANIDPSSTLDIEKMLSKINEVEKTTIVLITHNLAQGKRICKSILFLHKGIPVEYNSADEIFSEPKEELTSKFLSGELLV